MVVGLVGVAAFLVGSAGDADGFREAHDGTDPPLAWLPAPVSDVLGVVGLLLTVLLFFGAVFAVRARLRRSSGDERLQLLWLVWGATSLPAGTRARLGRALRARRQPVVVDRGPRPGRASRCPSRSGSRSCGTGSSTSSWC